MRHLRVLSPLTLVLTLALAGCNTASVATPGSDASATTAAVAQSQVLHFVGPMDLTLTLESRDNFETAVLTDNADRRFLLRSVPAASGVRMSDDKGVVIHFKNGDGMVELVPGKMISIREVKQP